MSAATPMFATGIAPQTQQTAEHTDFPHVPIPQPANASHMGGWQPGEYHGRWQRAPRLSGVPTEEDLHMRRQEEVRQQQRLAAQLQQQAAAQQQHAQWQQQQQLQWQQQQAIAQQQQHAQWQQQQAAVQQQQHAQWQLHQQQQRQRAHQHQQRASIQQAIQQNQAAERQRASAVARPTSTATTAWSACTAAGWGGLNRAQMTAAGAQLANQRAQAWGLAEPLPAGAAFRAYEREWTRVEDMDEDPTSPPPQGDDCRGFASKHFPDQVAFSVGRVGSRRVGYCIRNTCECCAPRAGAWCSCLAVKDGLCRRCWYDHYKGPSVLEKQFWWPKRA